MLPPVLSPQHFRDNYISPDSPTASGSLRGRGSGSQVDPAIERGQEAACSSSRETAADSAAAATATEASGDLEQHGGASSGTAGGGEEGSDGDRGRHSRQTRSSGRATASSMADAATPNLTLAIMKTSFGRGSLLPRPQLLQLYQVCVCVSESPVYAAVPIPILCMLKYFRASAPCPCPSGDLSFLALSGPHLWQPIGARARLATAPCSLL